MTDTSFEAEMKTYRNLCAQFYDIDKPIAPADALQFYLDYAKQADGPIFEPMCGTGRFLIPMLKLGMDIEGADASPYMLSMCKEKCAAQNLNAKLHLQYLNEMAFEKKFALIFIPSGSFGLLTDVREAKLALKKLYDHLLPSGKLVFEVETIKVVPNEFDTHNRASVSTQRTNEKIILDTVTSYDEKHQILKTICRYDLMRDNEIVSTEIEDFRIRLYQHNEMDDWITDAGFRMFDRYKAFEHQPPEAADEIIVYECIKRTQS